LVWAAKELTEGEPQEEGEQGMEAVQPPVHILKIRGIEEAKAGKNRSKGAKMRK
jgi:hypothetical protein